jgi:hypothetical protein
VHSKEVTLIKRYAKEIGQHEPSPPPRHTWLLLVLLLFFRSNPTDIMPILVKPIPLDPVSEPVGQAMLACDLIGAAPAGCLNSLAWVCTKPDDLMLSGTYIMAGDVRMFSGETIKLNFGRCRRWLYNDVKIPTYPLSGTYRVDNNRITFDIPGAVFPMRPRQLGKINGTRVIFHEGGLKSWNEKHEIQPYSVLFQVGPRK